MTNRRKLLYGVCMLWLASMQAVPSANAGHASYNIVAPIFVSHGQLKFIAECFRSDIVSSHQPFLQVCAETEDGLVVWIGTSGNSCLLTLPMWITSSGSISGQRAKAAYSTADILWNRKAEPSQLVWLTNDQVLELDRIVATKSKLARMKLGLMILGRTRQGLIFELRLERESSGWGPVLCVDNEGHLVPRDSNLPQTQLNVGQILELDRKK